MPESTQADVAVIGARLLGDAYLAWLTAETEAEVLLHAWFDATGQQREVAYLAYRAALEREDASARDLGRLSRLAAARPDTVVERIEPISR
jgi:hypothetical protein